MKVELDILWLDNEQTKLQEMGLDDVGHTIKRVTFYNISNISDYDDDGISRAVIASNGLEYITDLPYEKVKELIDLQLKS